MKYILLLILLVQITLYSNNGFFMKPIHETKNSKDILNSELLQHVKEKENYQFKVKKTNMGQTGIEYKKYQSYYKGILIDNNDVTLTFIDKTPTLLSGTFKAPKEMSLTAKYTLKERISQFKVNKKAMKIFDEPSKVLLEKEGEFFLVYRIMLEYVDKEGYHLGQVYLDANSQKVIDFKSHIYESLRRKVYNFQNKCLGEGLHGSEYYYSYYSLPRVCEGSDCQAELMMTEGTDTHPDESIQAAYTNTGITYWFYKKMFNRDSLDNHGISLISTVNVRFSSDQGACHGHNASFLGHPFYQMLYGAGDPSNPNDDFAKSLDVVAHELSHGVTNETSDLYYSNQSGALNEAMSDIFGAGTEIWLDNGGTSTYNPNTFTTTENNWKIGEAIGRPIRYMNDPILGDQPDHYSQMRHIGTPVDNGGVHVNSGIINLIFYLMVEGGKHPRRTSRLLTVEPIGFKKAIKIFYEAQIGLFHSRTNFMEARGFLGQAARNLYGACSTEEEQVHRAFDLLGVPGTRNEACIPACNTLNCEQYGATCISGATNYCACAAGYHWNENQTACEEDYPCYHVECTIENSHCEEIDEAAYCICDEGYVPEGQTCVKKAIDPCEGQTCGGNGTCSVQDDAPMCQCKTGYVNDGDLNCVKYESPCKDVDCSGNGNCIVKNNTALCACKQGYHAEGLACIEDEVQPCDGVTCNNHGTCKVLNDEASCVCDEGYENKDNTCVEKEAPKPPITTPTDDSNSCNYSTDSTHPASFIFLFMMLFAFILRKKKMYK